MLCGLFWLRLKSTLIDIELWPQWCSWYFKCRSRTKRDAPVGQSLDWLAAHHKVRWVRIPRTKCRWMTALKWHDASVLACQRMEVNSSALLRSGLTFSRTDCCSPYFVAGMPHRTIGRCGYAICNARVLMNVQVSSLSFSLSLSCNLRTWHLVVKCT